eukprot:scaffold7504_cov97-Cylindrotheca_fusiformis.AAC.10
MTGYKDGQRCTGGRRRRRASIRAECIGGLSLFSFNDHDGKRVDHPSSLSLQMSKKSLNMVFLYCN